MFSFVANFLKYDVRDIKQSSLRGLAIICYCFDQGFGREDEEEGKRNGNAERFQGKGQLQTQH